MNIPRVPNFGPVDESISWAKCDIEDLKTLCAEFFTQDNVSVIEEMNQRNGMLVTKMKIADQVPMGDFKRHAVSALLNTRNAFDQATNICGAHLMGGKFKKNFPWSDTQIDLTKHRLKDFPEDLRRIIEAQQPYPTSQTYTGGNDLIRALARLCNNKHSVGFSVDLTGGIDFAGDVSFVGNGFLQTFAPFSPNWDPVKQEVVLFSVKADGIRPKLNDNARLGFHICFEIPELPNPPEVFFALNEFIAASERNLELVKAVWGE